MLERDLAGGRAGDLQRPLVVDLDGDQVGDASEHATDLGDGNLVVQHARDLVEREAEVLQRQDAIEALQLAGAVIAIAGLGIDALRPQ